MMETYRSIVTAAQCDEMGHLNTVHYMDIFNRAAEMLMASCGASLSELAKLELGWADVSHAITYAAEIRAGSAVIVRSGIRQLGRTSVSHVHSMFNFESNAEIANLAAKTVCFDLVARKATELPVGIRQRMEELRGRAQTLR